jgi:hypothetical protein
MLETVNGGIAGGIEYKLQATLERDSILFTSKLVAKKNVRISRSLSRDNLSWYEPQYIVKICENLLACNFKVDVSASGPGDSVNVQFKYVTIAPVLEFKSFLFLLKEFVTLRSGVHSKPLEKISVYTYKIERQSDNSCTVKMAIRVPEYPYVQCDTDNDMFTVVHQLRFRVLFFWHRSFVRRLLFAHIFFLFIRQGLVPCTGRSQAGTDKNYPRRGLQGPVVVCEISDQDCSTTTDRRDVPPQIPGHFFHRRQCHRGPIDALIATYDAKYRGRRGRSVGATTSTLRSRSGGLGWSCTTFVFPARLQRDRSQ